MKSIIPNWMSFRTLGITLAGNFFVFQLEWMFPFLAILEEKHLNIYLIESNFWIGCIVSGLVCVHLIYRIGPKCVMIATTAVMTISMILFAFAQGSLLFGFVRLLQGVAFGGIMPARSILLRATISARVAEEKYDRDQIAEIEDRHQAKADTFASSLDYAIAMTVVLLSAWLVELLPFTVWALSGASIGVFPLVLSMFIPAASFATKQEPFRWRNIVHWQTFAVYTCGLGGLFVLRIFLSGLALVIGVSAAAKIVIVFQLSNVLNGRTTVWMAEKLGYVRIMYLSQAIALIAMVLLVIQQTVPFYVVAAVLIGIMSRTEGLGFSRATHNSAGETEKGAAASSAGIVRNLISLVAIGYVSFIGSQYGFDRLWLWSIPVVAITMISLPLSLWFLRKKGKCL